MNIFDSYENSISLRGYSDDPNQKRVVNRLQKCYVEWTEFRSAQSNFLKRLICSPKVPKGVYVHGGVGRGKSFLMDTFYSCLSIKRKIRLHFHEFMHKIHCELGKINGKSDSIDKVARSLLKRYRLICFDEFHVSDIADAMILHQLLLRLFRNGVLLIATSNYEPSNLYLDGLHRDRFLPAIDLIFKYMDIIDIGTGLDYRYIGKKKEKFYYTPIDIGSASWAKKTFLELSNAREVKSCLIKIGHNREILAQAADGRSIWFDFSNLCGEPLSQRDYLGLVDRFDNFILSNVFCMKPQHSSEARRFTWLVDILYNRRAKLAISAQCEPQELYTDGIYSTEFKRSVSRIIEMQSDEYKKGSQSKYS